MLLAIVIAHIIVRNPVKFLETALLRIIKALAVAVVVHIGAHICLIVSEKERSRMLVVWREVAPVPRRAPDSVVVGEIVEVVEDRRSYQEERIKDIIRSVDERRAYDLDVPALGRRSLDNDCGDVLEVILGKHGLNDEHVVISLHGLNDAKIVDITVAVQVKIGDDIGRVVEQGLELLDGLGLGESCAHSLKVKIERKIFDGRSHAGCRRDRTGTRNRDRGGIRSLIVVVRRYRHNTCRKTTRKQQRHCGENKDSCFHGISDFG